MRLVTLFGLIALLALPASALAAPVSVVVSDAPSSPLAAPEAILPDASTIEGAATRSSSVNGREVRANYSTTFNITPIRGYATSFGGGSGLGGRATFYQLHCNTSSCSRGSVSGGRFHHYRTEVEVFVNGVLRSRKRCSQRSTCESIATRSSARITTKARFCADRKDDGRGTICTPFSVATRY